MKLSRGLFYTLFIVALLTTEFFYIQVGSGVARIYHFWAIVVVVLLASSIPKLLRSGLFLALVAFASVNLAAALLSDSPSAALASLMSNYANLGIITAVALILLRGRLSVEQLARTVLLVTLISVAWAIMQAVGGNSLALSPEQEVQIQMGFGPGFRTEANTFGKYMVLPFLLFLPMFLHGQRNWLLRLAYAVMVVGILINFTRTALYGIATATAFAFIWYVVKGGLTKVMSRFFMIAGASALVIMLMMSGAVPVSEYAQHKFDTFFSKEEILEGGSSAYRLESMQAVLDNTLGNDKRLLIGNGWGQTYYEIQRQEVQAGGGDLINLLGYSGLAGAAAYLLYTFLAVASAARLARRRGQSRQTLLAEGVLFALVGMFVTGQISGYMIAPEYYLLLGLCVYLSLLPKGRPAPGAA